ncbi:hypothetical protein K458DRAFT_418005 [Lentithecium fluviatile CBS 122367]|uniref:Uncharacterized protein n=1 Tax=Lentithecium fluviatile CBS 122367 TaxID=1168545 RepID=A0A6G1J1P4_9PLEO|nr:hypothetical protein K458DRAFT_418005 [Lentithecium fluviatile CBS 122367]
MRAYRYTGDYGNPFNLNLFKPEERGWSHETAVVPVDGHLLIRYRYSRGFETPTDMLDFRDHINELCPHVRRMGLDAEKFDQELQSAAEYITNLPLSDLVAGYTHDLHRCPNCPTEVMIQVHAASLYPGRTSKAARALPYIISVTRYIDVGECRAPNEVEWRAVTTRLDQMDGYKGHRRRSWWMGDTSSQTDVNACEEWSRHCFESREPIYLRFRKQVA